MNHEDAKQVLAECGEDIELDEENGMARLHGWFAIEELHAVLQLLEYNA